MTNNEACGSTSTMLSGCRLFDAHHVPSSSAKLQQRPSIYAAATRIFSTADAACQTQLSFTATYSHDARVRFRSRRCPKTSNAAVQVCSDNSGRFCDDHDGDVDALQRQLSMLSPMSGEGDEYNMEVLGEQFRNLQCACGSSNRREEMVTPVANLDPRVHPAVDPICVFQNTDKVIALTAFSAADAYHEHPGASTVTFSPSSFLGNQLALSRYAKLSAETSVFRERCIGQFITLPTSSVAGCAAVTSQWFRVLHLSTPTLITLRSGTKWYIQSCTILHENKYAHGRMESSTGEAAQWIFRYPYSVCSVGVSTNTRLPTLRQGEGYIVMGDSHMQHDVGCGTHEAIYTHRQQVDGRADGCTLDPAFMRSMGWWEEGDGDEGIYGRSWEQEDAMVAAEGIWDTDTADTCVD